MTDGKQLLAEYVTTGSELVFRELVTRYVDLVYSAAVRLVNGDTHLAEDISQTVFAALARKAPTLSPDVMLGGWLHRHTCFVAANTMRGERRRQFRERQAVEMNFTEDHSAANLAEVAPILDDAINQLSAEDRSAIMLRFFEQQDFRSVGEKLGSNEEAARKRVGRALEKLHSLLSKRGVAFSATALATTLSVGAVQAAPAGLATTISASALASAAAGGATALTVLKIMSMTKLKVGIAGAIVAAAIAVPVIMQQQTQTKLRAENAVLREKAAQSEALAAENERLAKLASENKKTAVSGTKDDSAREVVKLRGEVGRLKQENANVVAAKADGPSTLSEMTMNPEMKKMIRDQQKMGLGMAYEGFAAQTKLPKEQAEKLVEVLADNVMENIDHITEVLRAGQSDEEMEQVFAAQEAALLEEVKGLLTDEEFTKYQDYTRDLTSLMTAEQFKAMMAGNKDEKDQKAKQLDQLLREVSRQALAEAGLSPDFQLAPTLNFRNFASEQHAEKNLKLLNDVYDRAAAKANFLSKEELKHFADFQAKAIGGSRMMLAMNRKMMSPGGK